MEFVDFIERMIDSNELFARQMVLSIHDLDNWSANFVVERNERMISEICNKKFLRNEVEEKSN